MTARGDLAAALELAAGSLAAVVDAPVRNAAPPVLAIVPGVPYMRPSPVVGCDADWRFDVWCFVPRESVDALDRQDALAEIVRTAVAMLPTGQWLGIERANIAGDDLAGVPTLATIVQVRITL